MSSDVQRPSGWHEIGRLAIRGAWRIRMRVVVVVIEARRQYGTVVVVVFVVIASVLVAVVAVEVVVVGGSVVRTTCLVESVPVLVVGGGTVGKIVVANVGAEVAFDTLVVAFTLSSSSKITVVFPESLRAVAGWTSSLTGNAAVVVVVTVVVIDV